MSSFRAIAVALLCGLALACGGPLGPLPGGRLKGMETTQPVEDWSFTHEVMLVQLETRPADPYSVTLGCIDHEGAIYVGSDDPSAGNACVGSGQLENARCGANHCCRGVRASQRV